MQIVALLLFLAAAASAQSSALPRFLGNFSVHLPAYVQFHATKFADVDPLDKFSLYVSTFDPRVADTDSTYILRSPGRLLSDVTNWELTLVDRRNYWPNDPVYMPSEVVGREGIVWTSGFLPPTKTAGQLILYFTDVDPVESSFNIASLDDGDYSYHRVIWYDVNHDGLLDALTARLVSPALGGPVMHLLWLENPGAGPSGGWAQHMIYEGGPDVHFRLTTFQAAGQDFDVLVGAEFFSERLTLYYAADGSDSFLSDPSTLIQLIIDETYVGQTFDLDIMDLNLDGRPEIVTCSYNHTKGNVFVFPVPDDFRTDQWERITIADDFIPNEIMGGSEMSPGAPHQFYSGREHELSGDKPYVFISGDDDGKHYILEPLSQDKNNWSYHKHLLVETGESTTGKFSIADIDNDGYNEIVAAGYSASQIYIYSYSH